MIRIKTKVIEENQKVCDIEMVYEQSNDVSKGEFLVILDKVKCELLEKYDIDEKKLKEILFE